VSVTAEDGPERETTTPLCWERPRRTTRPSMMEVREEEEEEEHEVRSGSRRGAATRRAKERREERRPRRNMETTGKNWGSKAYRGKR